MAIKVRALGLGYYDSHLRQPGAEFEIRDKKELGKWMEEIKPVKQEATKSGGSGATGDNLA